MGSGCLRGRPRIKSGRHPQKGFMNISVWSCEWEEGRLQGEVMSELGLCGWSLPSMQKASSYAGRYETEG